MQRISAIVAAGLIMRAVGTVDAQTPTATYQFEELATGQWLVRISVTGDTAGLSAFEFHVLGLTSAGLDMTDFDPLTLAALDTNGDRRGFVFQQQNKIGTGRYFFGASQLLTNPPLFDVGIMEASIPPDVFLSAPPTLLGTLLTEPGLGVDNFHVDPDSASFYLSNRSGDVSLGQTNKMVIPINAPLLAGDTNNDLLVSGLDLIAVQQNFGKVDPNMPTDGRFLGDANDDGLVTGIDLITVQENFGKTVVPTAIPEPAAAVIYVTLSAFCAVRTRQRTGSQSMVRPKRKDHCGLNRLS